MVILNKKRGKTYKIALLILLSLIFCQNISSQSITWQKTYHVFPNDFGYKILPAPDNCFYFVGYIDNIISSYCYVLKINQLGDTLWSKKVSGGTYTAALSHDSCCVIVNLGDSLNIVKIDKNANIVWSKYIPYGGICWDIQRLQNSNFVLCGNLNLSAIIICIDSNGNLLWNKIINSNQTIFNSVCEDVGSGLILTGNIRLQDTGRVFIYKTDYDGNYIWEQSYILNTTLNIVQKIIKINNTYYIGGNTDYYNRKTFIIKIDPLGNLLQTKIWIPYGTSTEFFDDLSFFTTNKLIVSKRVDSSSTLYTYAKAQILDTNFNLFKEQVYYPSYSYAIFSSILPLPNKDILFAGTFDYYTSWSGHRYDLYAVRTDSNLNTSAFPPIGIAGNNQNLPKEYALNQNFPNPFNPTTSIRYEIPKNAEVTIKVYDLLGKEVFSLNEYKQAGSYEVKFDGSNLASGMYFYSLEVRQAGSSTNGYKDVKKMVLLK